MFFFCSHRNTRINIVLPERVGRGGTSTDCLMGQLHPLQRGLRLPPGRNHRYLFERYPRHGWLADIDISFLGTWRVDRRSDGRAKY